MHSPDAELLVHPNVLAEPDDGAPAPGGQWLNFYLEAHGPPSSAISLRLLRQAAAALDFAHRRGQAHGSFGPGSIWISDAGHVKVASIAPRSRAEAQADMPALSWLAGTLLGSRAGQPRVRMLMRQASLGRFSSCSSFVEALRRECDPEAPNAAPASVSRRIVTGREVVRWTVLMALIAVSTAGILLALFLNRLPC